MQGKKKIAISSDHSLERKSSVGTSTSINKSKVNDRGAD